MNFFAKLSVVPIFFFPLIAAWAGTLEEERRLNNHQSKRLNLGKSRSEVPAGSPGLPGNRISWRQPLRGCWGRANSQAYQRYYTFGGEVRRGRFGVLGDIYIWTLKPALLRDQAWCQR